MFPSRLFSQKICSQSKKNVFGRTFPVNFPKFVLIIYSLLKMSQGQMLWDPDPELINVKSLNYTKPKLFIKTIQNDMWLPLQTFMSEYLSTSPRFWTPNTQSNKTTTYCWTNMKSLLKQLPRLPLMSTSSRSLSALGIFKMSSNYQNLSTGTTNNLLALNSAFYFILRP